MHSISIQPLTLLLWSLRSVVVLSVATEGFLIASRAWKRRKQKLKESLRGRAFSEFMVAWAIKQGVKQ